MNKRMISFLCIIIMIFTLIACQQNSSTIIGKWHPNESDQSDYFEFKEDGTISTMISGITIDGTYQLDENKITMSFTMLEETLLSEEGTYKIKDDQFIITIDNQDQVFTKVE